MRSLNRHRLGRQEKVLVTGSEPEDIYLGAEAFIRPAA